MSSIFQNPSSMTKRLSLTALHSHEQLITSAVSAKAAVNISTKDINSTTDKSREGQKLTQSTSRGSMQTSVTSSIVAGSNGSSVRAQRVLHFDSLSSWMQADPYVKYGYRVESNSFIECFWSLFYLHNEFVNIWSHLLPALFFLNLLFVADYEALYGLVAVSWIDNLVIQTYIAGTAACLLLSVRSYSLAVHS